MAQVIPEGDKFVVSLDDGERNVVREMYRRDPQFFSTELTEILRTLARKLNDEAIRVAVAKARGHTGFGNLGLNTELA